MEWKNVLKEDLKRDEGLRLKAYKCSAGVWTIGVGHTAGVKKGDVVTEARAMELLDVDMDQAIKDARKVCLCFDDLNGPRKTVVANMAFNLGAARLSGFKNTLACICAGDYAQAALNMLKSKWAVQVGQRANRLAKRMSTGEW
jgi:lysozyme